MLGRRGGAAIAESPFTGSQQIQEWPGSGMWTAKVELPPMRISTAAPWIAWKAACRGVARRFMLGPSEGKTPRGVATGSIFVAANAVKDAFAISLKGFPPNTAGVLLRRDFFEISNRLYMICSDEDSNGSGIASFDCWPSLREAHAEDTPVIINSPRGLFRFSTNEMDFYDANEQKIYDLSFEAIEAL